MKYEKSFSYFILHNSSFQKEVEDGSNRNFYDSA